MVRLKRISRRILTLVLSVCVGMSTMVTTVSAEEELVEYVIEGGESYRGYVELPDAEPESIYGGGALTIDQAGESLPSSYDARDYGYVTSVKAQSPYGTCWSFATMAAVESSLLKQGIVTDVDLSEFHLVNYSFNNVADPLGGTVKDTVVYSGTLEEAMQAGGNVVMASRILASWTGAVEEETAPYPVGSIALEALPQTTESAYGNDTVHLQQVYILNKSDSDAVKQAIMNYGIATASFYYSADYLNGDAYYTNATTQSNHGVNIVGWDDNYSKSNFGPSQPSSDGAWLVKNSWGTWFGSDGYCWISYEDTSLQSTMCILIGELGDNYDNNYQYDGCNYNGTYGSSEMVIANAFQVQDGECTESLEAVAFEIGSANVNYSIQIYTDLSDEDNPTVGTKMLTQPITGTALYSGYHTIKLPQPIELTPNQTFSVVITFDKNGEYFNVPVECSATWNNTVYTASAEPNQSYALFEGSKFWWDIGEIDNANFRIKAFTKNLTTESVVAVSGVEVTPDEAVLAVGETIGLTANVTPANATNQEVIWSSSDSRIASVDANGLVTAN